MDGITASALNILCFIVLNEISDKLFDSLIKDLKEDTKKNPDN